MWALFRRLTRNIRGIQRKVASLGSRYATLYVIDGLVDVAHPWFGGSVSLGYVDPKLGEKPPISHRATLIAALIEENFPGLEIEIKVVNIAVAIDGEDCHVESICRGVRYMTLQILKDRRDSAYLGLVANLSWVMKTSEHPDDQHCLERVINEAIDAGSIIVVAAGDQSGDASEFYPASDPRVITVGSLDENGKYAAFTNRGESVTIYDRGVGIVSPIQRTDQGHWGTCYSASLITAAIIRLMLLQSDMRFMRPFDSKVAKEIMVGISNDHPL